MIPQGSVSPSDFIVQFGKVSDSQIPTHPDTGANGCITFTVVGSAGLDGDDYAWDDTKAEVRDQSEAWGQLGVLARPLPPKDDQYAEVICLRLADQLVPIAHRDSRVRLAGNSPKAGTVGLVGYGGGFLTLDAVSEGDDGTLQTVYCPYSFSGGVPAKAHCITLDPTPGNESVTVVHGSGVAMLMKDGELTLKNAIGNAWIRLDANGITMAAAAIICNGCVVVGNAATATALLAGPASQASANFWLSP
jgi:hypothetical protein